MNAVEIICAVVVVAALLTLIELTLNRGNTMSSNVMSRKVEVKTFKPDDTYHCVDCCQNIVWTKRKIEWGWYDGKCGCAGRRWEMSPVTVKVERIDK
jgi:hypothetical protein